MCSKSEELQNVKISAYISFHCMLVCLGNLGRNRAVIPVLIASFTWFQLEWAEVMVTEHINYMHYTCSISLNTVLVYLLLAQIPVLSESPQKLIDALRSLFLNHIHLKGTQSIAIITVINIWCPNELLIFLSFTTWLMQFQICATRKFH